MSSFHQSRELNRYGIDERKLVGIETELYPQATFVANEFELEPRLSAKGLVEAWRAWQRDAHQHHRRRMPSFPSLLNYKLLSFGLWSKFSPSVPFRGIRHWHSSWSPTNRPYAHKSAIGCQLGRWIHRGSINHAPMPAWDARGAAPAPLNLTGSSLVDPLPTPPLNRTSQFSDCYSQSQVSRWPSLRSVCPPSILRESERGTSGYL
jgi:hypothetical protein